ncbi:MAG: outer membrane protein assembly factor BamA [Alphaproteobacteria bacterium]|nr:outer membrane protein assembly factor BamA [Alphaproteobacteria bacterium]
MTLRPLLCTTALGLLAAISPAIAQEAASPSPALSVPNTSGTIASITVEGNQRVEARTVISYLGLSPGNGFSQAEIDLGLKNLFATGFFADVKLLRAGNTLIVRVQENPIVSEVAFEGNDKVETKDLEKEVELQPRSIYSRDKIQSDVKRILDIYRRGGRYTATVTPKIIHLDANRVNIAYEISEGTVSRVAHITFIGNETFDSNALREAIRTEETRWYKFLTDNDRYDPDRLQFDQELLRRFYNNEGYADFQVKSAHAELAPEKDSFFVTFVVEEGKQYTFGDVKVESELVDRQAPDFTKILTTRSGDIYNAEAVEDTINAMTDELGNLGYAFVDIQPNLKKDEATQRADLTYIIKPGPRVYVERINITGNVRTRDEVVRREFRLSEGDPYNTAKLQRTEQRVNNLGFFEKVEIKNEPGSAPDKTVVNVDVQEKSTGEVNIGAGYSTTDGVLGDFGIKENNLLGRGQELRTRLTLAARRKQIELGFTEPYFLNRELAAGFDIYRTRLDFVRESSYNIDTSGINLRMGYSLQEKLKHNITYSLRSNDINDVQPGASRFILDQVGKTVTSSLGQALVYDDRDSKFDPHKGYYLSGSQEVAGLGGDSRYLKHELKGSYYYPISKKWTFSVLGSSGYVFGFGGRDVQINDRFFLGGDDLRGFRNAGVGPRDLATDDSLGGNAYYSGSTEVKFPLGLPEEMGVSGAVFTDVGSLWSVDDNGTGVFDSNTPRVSAGFGVMWASPFGPIRVDIAHALAKEDADQTENLRFSFGTRF